MKSSFEWMQDYVTIDKSRTPQEFADVLTIAGIPVEQVEYWGEDIQNVITGKITKSCRIPMRISSLFALLIWEIRN